MPDKQTLFEHVPCPTEKQHNLLLRLGGGNAWLSARKRECEPLLRREWVTATFDGAYYQWVRITPKGLAALALSVQKFGLPDLAPRREQRVCSECGNDWNPRCKCGSRAYRFVEREVTSREALASV